MGANLYLHKNELHIHKLDRFLDHPVLDCNDIRGGAACLLAALLSKTPAILTNVEQIFRGYRNLFMHLTACGVSIGVL